MEDPEKIKKILAELNKGLKTPVWIPSVGFHALMVVELVGNNVKVGNFKGNEGVPIKSFINTETGELRTYWVKHVIQD